MFKWQIIRRCNLFMLMLMLLFFYSFTSHSKQLCFGWQFENRHLSGKGFQVIRRSVKVPAMYGDFQFLFKQISFEIERKLIIPALYFLLIIAGGLWMRFFKYFIMKRMFQFYHKQLGYITYLNYFEILLWDNLTLVTTSDST